MPEPHFFKRPLGLTVGEIAVLTGAEPRNGAQLSRLITGIASLDRAGPSDLAYLNSAKYARTLTGTHAGACLMSERFESHAPAGLIVLRSQEPYSAFVAVARKLYPDALRPASLFEAKGVPWATVHSSAQIEHGVIIDPGAVVGPRAAIGGGTVIGATAVIGPDVHIGRDCSIGPGASIIHALIGDNVIIHPGCRIGQDGFRYHPTVNGHTKVPQIGRVIIQDNVEIGAGTTIDRGGGGDTVIGEGTKIDNLVQIGHSVTVGRHCIIVAQVGIAGSTVVEDFVRVGGQAAIAGHVQIGEGAQIGAQAGVISDMPSGAIVLGSPAQPRREFFRQVATLKQLARKNENIKE